jgi:pimeloyl-ACP methyl ester carboxylesterase
VNSPKTGISGAVLLDETTKPGRERGSLRAPAALQSLIARFDPEPMDLPDGSARIRLQLDGSGAWDAVVSAGGARLEPAEEQRQPDALLSADTVSWQAIARDARAGMPAFRAGRLRVRRNLHLGVGFIAATTDDPRPGRLRFDTVSTRKGKLSMLSAGEGDPLICVHGLGGTKASFLPTVAALADSHRVIAVDLPGFGDSCKPLAAPYDAPYFASAVEALMEALDLPRAHVAGNSMGGRVAIEMGLRRPEAVPGIALLSPALAWLHRPSVAPLLRLPVSKLGLIQPTPRGVTEAIVRRVVPGGGDGWAAAGVDEFLRSFLTRRGRAAFYQAACNILLDEPHGEDGFWTRLEGLSPKTMFVWGRQDNLVPIAFMRHVERALPAAQHVELDCGHVPQLERPHETHRAMRDFLADTEARPARRARLGRAALGGQRWATTA